MFTYAAKKVSPLEVGTSIGQEDCCASLVRNYETIIGFPGSASKWNFLSKTCCGVIRLYEYCVKILDSVSAALL